MKAKTTAPITPTGALSGTFRWRCANGRVRGDILLSGDKPARIQGWDLPEEFATLRRLMEGRMAKHGRREYVQVLRLLENFDLTDLHAAVKQAIQLGAIGFDAVKHLILCRVERRPPRLDLAIYPYLPRATVEKTSVKAYMRLLSSDAGEAA